MKKLIRAKGTEFEQNGCDLVIIDTNFRAGKPIMLNSAELDMAILNGQQEALDKIEVEDKKLQDVTVELEKNGVLELKPEEGYHGIGNITIDAKVVEDLDAELSVIDNEVLEQAAVVTEALTLLQSRAASTETLDNINIYIQQEEPTFKEGIWLQTDKNISRDFEILNSEYKGFTHFDVWRNLDSVASGVVNSIHIDSEDYVYLMSGNQTYNYYQASRYNKVTKETEILETMPRAFYYGAGVEIEGKLYMFGGDTNLGNCKAGLVYDIENNLYSDLASMPFGCKPSMIINLGNELLILCSYIQGSLNSETTTNKVLLYDIENNIYTEKLAPFYFDSSKTKVLVGEDLFIIGGYLEKSVKSKYVYKWNLRTDEVTQLCELPESMTSTVYCCYALGKIVCISKTTGFIYDIALNSFEERPELAASQGVKSFTNNNKTNELLTIDYDGRYPKYMQYTIVPTYSNTKDCIVLQQRKGLNKFETVMWPCRNTSSRLLTGFDDIIYYSTETGIDDTIPTYYGTGNKWIKIRG